MQNNEYDEKNTQKRPYTIQLSDKAAKVLRLRRRTLYTMGRLNWVEDGIFVVIEQIICGSDKLSNYLHIRYPKTMPESRRRNDTEDERKTLKYRFRYLFRCLDIKAEYYEELEQWKFSGLEFALQAFVDIIGQALGADVGRRLNEFYLHFRSIWVAVNPDITCVADFRREVRKLIDEVDEVFELMLAASLRLEAREADVSRAEESMARAVKALESAAREQRQTNRIVAKVAGVAASHREVADDEYGRYAGLEAFNEAQRTELKAAIDKLLILGAKYDNNSNFIASGNDLEVTNYILTHIALGENVITVVTGPNTQNNLSVDNGHWLKDYVKIEGKISMQRIFSSDGKLDTRILIFKFG